MGRVYPNISLYLVKILLYAKKEFGSSRDFMNPKNSKKIENIRHFNSFDFMNPKNSKKIENIHHLKGLPVNRSFEIFRL